MEVLGKILCDYGVTQPLYYGKEDGKFYFLIAPISGFGDTGKPKKYLTDYFDEIIPLPAMDGTCYIGVRTGNTWKLWRYSSLVVNPRNVIPSEAYVLDRRVLEELSDIKGNSIDECLNLISKNR